MKNKDMKNIKIPAFFALVFSILLVFSACGVTVNHSEKKEKDKPYIVCTVFPQYDFIKNIVGDKMTVELLVPPGTDTHSFGLKDLSPSKIEELYEADLIVSVGGESDESLIDELKTALSGSKAEYTDLLSLSDDLLVEEETPGMHESGEEEEHEEKTEYDEHIWTSPKRAISLSNALLKKLCALDFANGAYYEANAGAYIKKLETLDGKYEELTAKKTVDTLIFADRFPFRYLCYDYNLTADAAFKGCSTSVEPPIATLEFLYNKAQALHLPAILYMEGSDPKYAKALAERIGGKALMLHSCHIISQSEFENETYLTLMEKNLAVLAVALGAEG